MYPLIILTFRLIYDCKPFSTRGFLKLIRLEKLLVLLYFDIDKFKKKHKTRLRNSFRVIYVGNAFEIAAKACLEKCYWGITEAKKAASYC